MKIKDNDRMKALIIYLCDSKWVRPMEIKDDQDLIKTMIWQNPQVHTTLER